MHYRKIYALFIYTFIILNGFPEYINSDVTIFGSALLFHTPIT